MIVILQISISSILTFFAVALGTLQVMTMLDGGLRMVAGPSIERCVQLRMNETLLTESLRWWIVVCVVVTGTLFYLDAIPFAVLFAIIGGWNLPLHVLAKIISQRESKFEAQLISATNGIANSLKAGLTISDSLRNAGADKPAFVANELNRIVYQVDFGVPLTESLAAARKQIQLEAFTMFCLALEVASCNGGRATDAMMRLRTSLQEWFRLRRKLESETASGRYAIGVMSLFPFGFVLAFFAMGMNDVLLLFTTLIGQLVMSCVLLMTFVAIKWASKITDIKLT